MHHSPRLRRDRLIETFHSYGSPRSEWLIGAEFERHVLRSDGTPLPYFGERGVRWLLESLAERGWVPEYEGDNPIALRRGNAWITLEPGSQFELSGSASDALQPVYDEALVLAGEVDEILAETTARQVSLGFTPFADIERIEWVPKGRYVVMREHMRAAGPLSHHMMKGTCAVQATYDYADEADCARKAGLASMLGPLTTAMFANSPLALGEPTGFMSYRGYIWTRTDPQRTGFPAVTDDFTFEAWVDYLLGVQMMYVRGPNDTWLPADGRTFGEWMAEDRSPPTIEDWQLHTNGVFPEVRVKRTIEVRGADCVPLPLAMSFAALFKGLFYCDQAFDEARELAARLTSHGTKEERFLTACRDGLHGVVGGVPYAAWAEELVTSADGALERCAPDDRRWLGPLADQIATGESPARGVLRRWVEDPSVPRLIAEAHVLGPPGRQ